MDIEQVKKTRRQVFLYKAYYAKHWGVLLRKHCKEGASVATQFLTHVLINFQKNSKIAKNIENPKKYIFNTFASFLAFAASSKNNLNFQKLFERVQLLTFIDFPHWVDADIARFQKIQKKLRKIKFTKKRKLRDQFWDPCNILPINTGPQLKQRGGGNFAIKEGNKKTLRA